MSKKICVTSKKEQPNWQNVLKRFREIPNPTVPYENALKAHVPSVYGMSRGAKAAIFGGSPCPWCDCVMDYDPSNSSLAICSFNETHIVEWLPWGG